MTWLRNEDAAVKAKFSGLTVTDANAPTGRPVAVRFADPEMEFADLTFPIILIARQNMVKAEDREHRGYAPVTYWPDVLPDSAPERVTPADAPLAKFPVPMDIVYQITVLCRRADHQTQLAAAMSAEAYLPQRFGWVEVPQDGSVRTLTLDGGPEYSSGKDETGKRVLTTHYVIRIPTEAPPEILTGTDVSTVDLAIDLKQ